MIKTLSGPSARINYYSCGAFDTSQECEVSLVNGQVKYLDGSYGWVSLPVSKKVSLDIHREIAKD